MHERKITEKRNRKNKKKKTENSHIKKVIPLCVFSFFFLFLSRWKSLWKWQKARNFSFNLTTYWYLQAYKACLSNFQHNTDLKLLSRNFLRWSNNRKFHTFPQSNRKKEKSIYPFALFCLLFAKRAFLFHFSTKRKTVCNWTEENFTFWDGFVVWIFPGLWYWRDELEYTCIWVSHNCCAHKKQVNFFGKMWMYYNGVV